jgi:hypothetical protein
MLVVAFLLSLLMAAGYPLVRPAAPVSAATTSVVMPAPDSVSYGHLQMASAAQTRLTAYDAQAVVLQKSAAHAAVLAAQKIAQQKAAAAQAAAAAPPPVQQQAPAATGAGVYSPAMLAAIWEAHGGSAAKASVAVCIAEHESGGRPWAVSPTNDYGLWQEHNDPAALNPGVSAATAVQMSGDGTNWSAWTTAGSCGV